MNKVESKDREGLFLMVGVFLLVSIVVLLFKDVLKANGFDVSVILIGNVILSLMGIISLKRTQVSVNDPNPYTFVKSFYLGFIIRVFVFALAAGLYIYFSGDKFNKSSLFACLILYAVYLIIEVSTLRKLLKGKKNA